uniref:L71-3 n=1 Tax=Drosophila melanogaster TaxID=7227 RepID=Q24073_DROME|nr:L71-3 [Drosophila melanogaster]
MSKITLIFAILCLCMAVQAQTREQEICRQENETCRRNERRLGVQNDVSTTFNNHCRRQSGIRNWRNVSRCELSLATCRLTLERCAVINCKNVRNSIDGGVTARPPTSRRTTRRIPDTRRPRTTRRTPTTRRAPTTRSSRRTTRRRAPTTRTTRRTTRRRAPTTRTTTRRPTEE